MGESSFYGEHLCTVCFGWMHEHDERCWEGEVEHWHTHFPALCCPGCDCRSFEEAHPKKRGKLVREPILMARRPADVETGDHL